MHASDQSELQSVCVSFLVGFGIPHEQALAHVAAAGIDSSVPDVLTSRLIELAAAAGARDHECLYVSTPITTGRHYLRADDAVRHEIRSDNLERAKVVVESLRATRTERVIDPTRLEDVPGWEQQEHYHNLWVAVIRRFARTVVFVDNWQYSVGCTMEFQEAYRLALPIFTQDLEPLAYERARQLLSAAAHEVRDVSGGQAPLLRAVAEVEQLVGTRQPPGVSR